MAKVKKRVVSVGPELENISDAESRALDHELRLWAELLLDIYLDKRRRKLEKKRESKDFDVAEHGQ